LDSSQRRLQSELDRFGGFEKVSEDRWEERVDCDVCQEQHLVRTVDLTDASITVAPDLPLGSHVRLTDGSSLVTIGFGSFCLEQPFRNLTVLLAKTLNMRLKTEYQIFDSLSSFLSALRFSVPGSLYEWDGPEPGDAEQWAIETGHLIKMHFQRGLDSPIVDFAIDLHESNNFRTDQFGLAFSRFGLLATFWGAEMNELEAVQSLFEEFVDDYAKLLGATP
jgi:hypothetical protein